MKPSKQQSSKNTSKKEVTNEKSVPTINKYFKSVPKSFFVDDENDNNNNCETSRAFYIQELQNRLKACEVECEVGKSEGKANEQEDGANAVVIANGPNNETQNHGESSDSKSLIEWKQAATEWKDKYIDLKKKYVNLTIYCSEMVLKYNDLLKLKTGKNQPDINVAVGCSGGCSGDIFSSNEIKYLRSLPLDKKKDSTFIHQCLEYAYKSDLSILCGKTLKGKPELVEVSEDGSMHYVGGKEPLTPKKVQRIKELFIERISKCKIDSVGYSERMRDSAINKLFASGVRNIAKKYSVITKSSFVISL